MIFCLPQLNHKLSTCFQYIKGIDESAFFALQACLLHIDTHSVLSVLQKSESCFMFCFYVYDICNCVNEDSYACIALDILRLTVIDQFYFIF